MVLLTFGSAEQFKANLNAVQATYGLISPSGCLLRVFLLSLNQSQLLCRDQAFVSYPGAITVYGGPYLYFILQCAGLYTFLVAYDSGWRPQVPMLRRSAQPIKDFEKEYAGLASDVRAEEIRTEESCDELRLLHLRKDFRNETVVDNATLGVDRGSILSLLGPNGAGKTTTLGLIRGDLRSSSSDSEVLVSGLSVRTDKLAARRHLGVCPQFNALDRMTVKEHLSLYARTRGVPNVARSVVTIMEGVGIVQYSDRFTAQLSGGNQRKLSLATAIIGNPSVVLLDEPSSGMDALAMRTMWQAIRDVSSQRAVLITTHSMEEATALSDKVAIMDKRILSVGSPAELKNSHGKGVYQVHVALGRGSHATNDDVWAVCNWIINRCSAARVLRGPMSVMHGQARFQIAFQQMRIPRKPVGRGNTPDTARRESSVIPSSNNSLSGLLMALEESKQRFGVEYYSISPTTLEDVFLKIVGSNRRN